MPGNAQWQQIVCAEGDDMIVHHDLGPWNFVAGDRMAIIDWDCSAPGSRLWDIAYALHGFVPLSAEAKWQHVEMDQRMRAFVDAYGLDESERQSLVPMLARRSMAMHDFLIGQAKTGAQPWARLVEEGHADVWRNDASYTDARQQVWLRALLN